MRRVFVVVGENYIKIVYFHVMGLCIIPVSKTKITPLLGGAGVGRRGGGKIILKEEKRKARRRRSCTILQRRGV